MWLLTQISFRDATKEAGLDEPLAGMMGHGAAWGDFDADGKLDLFVGGFCDRPNADYKPADGPVSTRLLRNLGGRFERTRQAELHARTSGAVFADLDNDGDLDLVVANNAQAQARRTDEPQRSAQTRRCALFRNDKGTLVDVSAECGACPDDLLTARNIGVLDHDADGRLDLLIVEDRFTRSPRTRLFLNAGGLKFVEKPLLSTFHGLGLAIADLDGDLRPDFFVAHSNRLFLSRGREVRDPFDWKPVDGEDWPCGAAFGDVNRDGVLDLVVSGHHDPARVRLWLGPDFREATVEAGLDALVPTKAPHCEIQDFDNDGWPDIYVSAAWADGTPLVWRSLGAKAGVVRFEPPRPMKDRMAYYPAGPSGDYDGDGRLDLVLVNWFGGRSTRLLRNESAARRWLDVEVVGRTFNRMGIGSKVRVTKAGALLGFQEVTTGYGYASGQRAYCHFGLGDAAEVDVEVTLPDGKKVVKEKVAADRLLRIEE